VKFGEDTMIIYLHGFDSNSPGNHEKVLQLQFIDPADEPG
jgi:predicted esterase YcpF (UPF0227 family)